MLRCRCRGVSRRDHMIMLTLDSHVMVVCAGERQLDIPNDSAAAVVGAGQPFGTLSPASAIHRPLVRRRSAGAAHPSRVMTVPDRISAHPIPRQATRLTVAPHRGHTLLWQNTWCHPWMSTCMHGPCDSRVHSWPRGISRSFTPSACGPGHLELSTPTRAGLVNYLLTHPPAQAFSGVTVHIVPAIFVHAWSTCIGSIRGAPHTASPQPQHLSCHWSNPGGGTQCQIHRKMLLLVGP